MVQRQTAVTLGVRNLVTIALNVEKSDKSNLYQERSDHEADMIRSMKRRVTLNVKRIVLYGDIKNKVSCPTD
jgi:hypothetical protein